MKTTLDTKITILSVIPVDYATNEDLGLVEFCEENEVLMNLCESIELGHATLTADGIVEVEEVFDELCYRFGYKEDLGWKTYDEFVNI